MQRRYARLPEAGLLSSELTQLAAEADKLAERLRIAEAEQRHLGDEATMRRAEQTDADAATLAIRKGRSAAAVGTPARDKLIKEREAIVAEVVALDRAIVAVEDCMAAEFGRLRDDETASWRARVTTSAATYRSAVASLIVAHREYVEARSLVAYVEGAARAHSALRQPLWWNAEASDPGVRMPPPPGRPEPGPQLTFEQAMAVVTADLADNEER
jgi:hypothetical protein